MMINENGGVMGEYANDLIDAGMMEDHPFGYHSSHSNHSNHSNRVSKSVDVDFVAFSNWYNSHNWDGCSQYEICSMAWNEVVKRCNYKANDIDDDNFTWWFDSCDLVGVFKIIPLTFMAWNEAKKRCHYA